MKQQMNEKYFYWIEKVLSIPAVIDAQLFQNSVDKIDGEKYPLAVKA